MERSGTGKLHYQECCSPSQQSWVQAKLFLAGWQSLGAQASGSVLCPQLLLFPAHPVLPSSILLPERGWNWYLTTKKTLFWWSPIFWGDMEKILTHSPCSSGTEKSRKQRELKSQLIWFLVFELKEMQKKWTKLALLRERVGSLKFSGLGYHTWYIKPDASHAVKLFPFILSLEKTTEQ